MPEDIVALSRRIAKMRPDPADKAPRGGVDADHAKGVEVRDAPPS